MSNKCGTTYCDLDDGHVGTHCMAWTAPTHRVERCGNLYVYVPIKPVRS